MIEGSKVADASFNYLGRPYSQIDCQELVEQCLEDAGWKVDLTGSNAWYRKCYHEGWVGTPEECKKKFGKTPKGAFLFIHAFDGGEEKRGYHDGLGNASHIGLCTMPKGKGAVHASSTKQMVAESAYSGKTIKNGGWNKVGLLPNHILYDGVTMEGGGTETPDEPAGKPSSGSSSSKPSKKTKHFTIWKGDKGGDVRACQKLLMNLGFDLGSYGADGEFGEKTEAAVIAFQRLNGLEADGIVGPATWEALESADPMDGLKDEDDSEPRYTLYRVTISHLTGEDADEILARYGGVKTPEE